MAIGGLINTIGTNGEGALKAPPARTTGSWDGLPSGGKLEGVAVSDGFLGSLGFGKTKIGTGRKESASNFWNLAQSAQKRWDRNKDGFLTDGEIEKALRRKDLDLDQKATLQTLRGKQSQLEEIADDEFGDENDGVTANDLKALKNGNSQDARLIVEQFKIEKGLNTDKKRIEKPADLTSKIGTRDYYIERYEDFRRRNPDKAAPPYYLYYGVKYFDRFTALKSEVQPETREWIDKTAKNLHRKIEERNTGASFAELELDHEAFKQFAYESHPSAYLESGLNNVPVVDLAKIPFVPDSGDLLTVDGATQAAETGVGYAKNLLGGAWDDVKSWFD